MKKIYAFFAAMLMTLSMSAASYGILVNGKMYYAGTNNPTPGDPSFQEYMVLGVSLNQGDYCQLYDADNKKAWVVTLDQYSTSDISMGDGKYTIGKSTCYDFYIKLKYEADQLYVGGDATCSGIEGVDISGQGGGGGQGGGQGGGEDDDVNYYAIGWINGGDHGESAYDVFEDDFLFVDGKLTINCTMGSYICIKDHMGNFYRSKTPTTIADTQVTFDWQNGWAGGEKWAIPEGVNYIIIRSATYKGQIKLERVDKATYDAYHYGSQQGIENTPVSNKARKMFIDGQLRIVRGDKIYDATGREL